MWREREREREERGREREEREREERERVGEREREMRGRERERERERDREKERRVERKLNEKREHLCSSTYAARREIQPLQCCLDTSHLYQVLSSPESASSETLSLEDPMEVLAV